MALAVRAVIGGTAASLGKSENFKCRIVFVFANEANLLRITFRDILDNTHSKLRVFIFY